MSKNFDLMYRVLDYIETHPAQWDQSTFAETTGCGTTFCFAGHAIMMGTSGVTVDEKDYFRDEHGRLIDPEEDGASILGLTYLEANRLFYTMTHDPQDLRNIVKEWESAES